MIENLISPASIIFELTGTERDEVLAELTENLISQDSGLNRKEVFQSLVEREEKMSTVVEKRIAVPHFVSAASEKITISLGLSHNGVDFNLSSEDDGSNPVNLVFCIAFPKDKTEEHLALLKDILILSKEPDFVYKMLACNNSKDVCDLICSIFNE